MIKIEDMPKTDSGRIKIVHVSGARTQGPETCDRIAKLLSLALESRHVETSICRPLVLSAMNDMIYIYNLLGRMTATQVEPFPEREHVNLGAADKAFTEEALKTIAFVKGCFNDPFLYANNDNFDDFQQAAVVNLHKAQYVVLGMIEQLLP